MSGKVAQQIQNSWFPDAASRPDDPNPALRIGVSGRVLKSVATVIALRARDNGSGAHPGLRQIALSAQINYSTARRAIAHLLADEWIFLERRGDKRRSDTYALNLRKLSPSERVRRAHPGSAESASHALSESASHALSESASGRAHDVHTSIRPAADAAGFSSSECTHPPAGITRDGDCALCLRSENLEYLFADQSENPEYLSPDERHRIVAAARASVRHA